MNSYILDLITLEVIFAFCLEDFKKRLSQVAATLDEEKEKKQEQIHKEALEHLKHVKKERL